MRKATGTRMERGIQALVGAPAPSSSGGQGWSGLGSDPVRSAATEVGSWLTASCFGEVLGGELYVLRYPFREGLLSFPVGTRRRVLLVDRCQALDRKSIGKADQRWPQDVGG